MSIQELWVKFKGLLRDPEFHMVLLIIGVALVSFFLGRESIHEQLYQNATVGSSPMTEREQKGTQETATVQMADSAPTSTITSEVAPSGQTTTGSYVASKSGTKYYLPWCGGVKRIKDENKVWFKTKDEAEGAGYSPAANCKGI